MARSSVFKILASSASLVLLVIVYLGAAAVAPGDPAFQARWERTDDPVLTGQISRTWIWGPEANTNVMQEAYTESPGGMRDVQYYDKSRMEINDPSGNPNDLFYVTNGLLVVELMTGRLQLGDNSFEQHSPAVVNVAGDADDPTGPTYATMGSLRDLPPLGDGAVITQRVNRAGVVTNDPSLASQGVTTAQRLTVPGIDHQIAAPFWTFMNSSGLVMVNGQYVTEALFTNPYYATGFPITEAYWANVKVGGTYRDVLMQCFERRCLTYTPGNPPGFATEAGNVGQHYYTWRYTQIVATATATEPGASATATGTASASVTETVPATGTASATATVPATIPDTATEYSFLDKLGLQRDGARVYAPNTVAAAPGGEVYVTNTEDRQILKYSPDGVLLTAWGSEGDGNGEFMSPRGIAVDSQGYVYVADKSQNRIQKFDANGVFIRTWGNQGIEDGEFDKLHDVAIGPNDEVFVTDQGNHRIQKFSADGDFLDSWGELGSAVGKLNSPHGLHVTSDGFVYVTDSVNDRVQIFDDAGVYQGGIGQSGTEDGQFDHPLGISVAGNGDVYVTETGNDRVQIFSYAPVVAPTSGVLQAVKYQYTSTLDSQFIDPTGVDIDANGRVVVANRGQHRIHIFASTGIGIGGPLALVDTWTDATRGRFGSQPQGVEINSDGFIYVADRYQGQIEIFTSDGDYVKTWGPYIPGGVNGELDEPTDIAFDSDGYVYIVDNDEERVVKLDPTGNYIGQFGNDGAVADRLSNPWGIAIDSMNNIYVTDFNNFRIQKYSPNLVLIDTWGEFGTEPGQFDTAGGIAIHGTQVFATDSRNHRVQVFDLDGNFLHEWGIKGLENEGFLYPWGIVVDADGYVYVSDWKPSIQKFAPDGTFITSIGEAGAGDDQLGVLNTDSVSIGLAVDVDGNVFFSKISDVVLVFEPVS